MSIHDDPITAPFSQSAACPHGCVAPPAVQICLLGSFRLAKAGQAVRLSCGGKAEGVLFHLALRHAQRVPRDTLIDLLWPETDRALANQSLNSVAYSLHKLLGDAIAVAAPLVCED